MNKSVGRVGLFWFSKDYSQIIKIEGEKDISESDLLKPDRINPIGLHMDFDMPRDTPRGRSSYGEGIFSIWVGEDNPLSDEVLIDMIKKNFGLETIDQSKFTVRNHYHWNTKKLCL